MDLSPTTITILVVVGMIALAAGAYFYNNRNDGKKKGFSFMWEKWIKAANIPSKDDK